MKTAHIVSILFWGVCVAIAITAMLSSAGEDTGENLFLLLVSSGFLVLTLWVAWRDWLLNDKGVWDKLQKAIEKGQPQRAARYLGEILKEGDISPACKDAIADYLRIALQKEQWEVATAMLKAAGADSAAILTPPHYLSLGVLEWCVAEGNLPTVRLLLEHCAPPDAGTYYPPLLEAIAMGRQDIADLLLAHGATPHGANAAYNPARVTALHLLCCNKRAADDAERRIRTATRILQDGANINARTICGFTPLDAAMDSRFSTGEALPELPDFLRAHGAKRGALLCVPQASFCAKVLLKSPPTELPATSHGCPLHRVETTVDQAEPHALHVQLTTHSAAGELPLAAAHRLALATQELCHRKEAVAADLGGGYTPAAELATAEYPLLYMLHLHPCTTENQAGLETEGMSRFGLPELRAVDTPGTPRDWLVFAICHVLDALLKENFCPLAESYLPVGETDEDDIWSADAAFSVCPAARTHGKGSCLEIKTAL